MNKNLIVPAVPAQDSQDMDDLRIVESRKPQHLQSGICC